MVAKRIAPRQSLRRRERLRGVAQRIRRLPRLEPIASRAVSHRVYRSRAATHSDAGSLPRARRALAPRPGLRAPAPGTREAGEDADRTTTHSVRSTYQVSVIPALKEW